MSVRTFMRDDSPITVRSTAHAVMAANKFLTAAKGAENMVARWSPTKSRLGTSSPKRQLGGIGSAAANQGGSRDASPAAPALRSSRYSSVDPVLGMLNITGTFGDLPPVTSALADLGPGPAPVAAATPVVVKKSGSRGCAIC